MVEVGVLVVLTAPPPVQGLVFTPRAYGGRDVASVLAKQMFL